MIHKIKITDERIAKINKNHILCLCIIWNTMSRIILCLPMMTWQTKYQTSSKLQSSLRVKINTMWLVSSPSGRKRKYKIFRCQNIFPSSFSRAWSSVNGITGSLRLAIEKMQSSENWPNWLSELVRLTIGRYGCEVEKKLRVSRQYVPDFR